MSLDVHLYEANLCPHCNGVLGDTSVYDANITHNLNKMATAAGIYAHLWRPDEIGVKYAKELITPLAEGLAKLKADPVGFGKYDAPNGWGTYPALVGFVEKYLDACIEHPDAKVEVSR
jgi:hypothetical protein